MSDIPYDPTMQDDEALDQLALSALQDGFQKLDTLEPATQIEAKVKQGLTSGTDFDPLARQIGRRVVWTAVPAVAVFLVSAGILTLRPVPRIPLTRWVENQNRQSEYTPFDGSILKRAYSAVAPLPAVNGLETGFNTSQTGQQVPSWFKRPPVTHTTILLPGTPSNGPAGIGRMMSGAVKVTGK